MKPRLKGSLMILLIILALVLPGAYGINMKVSHNGGTVTYKADVTKGGTAWVDGFAKSNTGPIHFYGNDVRKIDVKGHWETKNGDNWAMAKFGLTNADSYDAYLQGCRVNPTKLDPTQFADASLTLKAQADKIFAEAEAGTGKKNKAGVLLDVETGTVDVNMGAHADGPTNTATAGLDTCAPGDNAITGNHIKTNAWFWGGTTGDVYAHIHNGALNDYHLTAYSSLPKKAYVDQRALGTTLGSWIGFSLKSEKPGSTSKKMDSKTDVSVGYVNNYKNYIDFYWNNPSVYKAGQSFDEAGTDFYASIENNYYENSKNTKIAAYQDGGINGAGTIETYTATTTDPLVVQSIGSIYAGTYGNYASISLDGYYNAVINGFSRTMTSDVDVNGFGYITGFDAASGTNPYSVSTEYGTKNHITEAGGASIYLDNNYWNNKQSSASVSTSLTAGSTFPTLQGKMTDVMNAATIDLAANKRDVRSQGHTDNMGVSNHAEESFAGTAHADGTDTYAAGATWYNYFYGHAGDHVYSANPEAVIANGHFVTGAGGDTIQAALNAAPNTGAANNNLFLDLLTYTGAGNKNVVNNIAGTEKSFTAWGAGAYQKIYSSGIMKANTVIDMQNAGRAFDLTSGTSNALTFDFKNINFNNGNIDRGGAIKFNAPTPVPGSSATSTIENCNFHSNDATAYGGAIYSLGTKVTLWSDDTTKFGRFTANTATNGGGAIFNGMLGDMTIRKATFGDGTTGNKNTAGRGGAIENSDGTTAAIPTGKAKLTVVESTFNLNTATSGNGGAILNRYWSGAGHVASEVIVQGCTFTSNTASNFGGAYAGIGTGNINTIQDSGLIHTAFNSNTANGGANSGGAIYTQGATNSITGVTYSANSPNDITTVP